MFPFDDLIMGSHDHGTMLRVVFDNMTNLEIISFCRARSVMIFVVLATVSDSGASRGN